MVVADEADQITIGIVMRPGSRLDRERPSSLHVSFPDRGTSTLSRVIQIEHRENMLSIALALLSTTKDLATVFDLPEKS
jgi:hypothetical protein